MPDLVVRLEEHEQQALHAMAGWYGMQPEELATWLMSLALDQVAYCAIEGSPSRAPSAPIH